LKLPISSADSLESYISRLELKLDVWAVNLSKDAQPHHNASDGNQRELIFSDRIKKSDDPIVIIREDVDNNDSQLTALLLWETVITLNRPRVRFANAAIIIAPSGTYVPEQTALNESDEYLPSFIAPQVNILDPLKAIRKLQDNPPYLAASRLERVLPHTPASDAVVRIPHLPSSPIRVVPAVIARLRCSRIYTPSEAESATIASLEIEVIPFVEVRGSLEQVDVSMVNGLAEPLGPPAIPLPCRSRDIVVLLYKLHPSRHLKETASTGTLSISLILKASLSSHCTTTIHMDWTTSVDLPPTQPTQRHQRPTSLPLNTSLPTTRTNTPRPALNSSATGLKISFKAPTTPITLHKPFTWTILIVNNTSKPVKLALIPLPHIHRVPQQSHTKMHAPQTSTASFHRSEKRHLSAHSAATDVDLAQAVCDENIIYALQHSNAHPTATDIVNLTAELRIGPLGPGACHECEIRMVALRRGALRVEAVRVVDLVREAEEGPGAPGVVTDVRELPDVYVV
jgi:TRAPP trafficking subunit Trs65